MLMVLYMPTLACSAMHKDGIDDEQLLTCNAVSGDGTSADYLCGWGFTVSMEWLLLG